MTEEDPKPYTPPATPPVAGAPVITNDDGTNQPAADESDYEFGPDATKKGS